MPELRIRPIFSNKTIIRPFSGIYPTGNYDGRELTFLLEKNKIRVEAVKKNKKLLEILKDVLLKIVSFIEHKQYSYKSVQTSSQLYPFLDPRSGWIIFPIQIEGIIVPTDPKELSVDDSEVYEQVKETPGAVLDNTKNPSLFFKPVIERLKETAQEDQPNEIVFENTGGQNGS